MLKYLIFIILLVSLTIILFVDLRKNNQICQSFATIESLYMKFDVHCDFFLGQFNGLDFDNSNMNDLKTEALSLNFLISDVSNKNLNDLNRINVLVGDKSMHLDPGKTSSAIKEQNVIVKDEIVIVGVNSQQRVQFGYTDLIIDEHKLKNVKTFDQKNYPKINEALGVDFFHHMGRTCINMESLTIGKTCPQSDVFIEKEIFYGSQGHIYFPIKLNGQYFSAFFDPGFDMSVLYSSKCKKEDVAISIDVSGVQVEKNMSLKQAAFEIGNNAIEFSYMCIVIDQTINDHFIFGASTLVKFQSIEIDIEKSKILFR